MASTLYYCLIKLHRLPQEVLSQSEEELAFTIAAILRKTKNDKKQAEEMKRKARRR